MKKVFVGLLAFGLMLLSSETAFAQKGKSYSTGSSSSSKPSSSSSSSSGKSYSTGSSSKPSYTPPASKPSTPSYSPPVGKSYSTGSSPAASKPSSPSPTPAGKSYSSGNPNTSSQPPPSGKPSGGGWNPGLSESAKREESKKAYQQATKPAEAPKPTYRTSKGEERPIKADSPQVTTVRKYVTHERYVTYDSRASVFYGGYYGHPAPYNDFFSPFLLGWMMSDAMNSHQRALWMYHNGPISSGGTIDDARYAEMLRRDAKLQAEIDALKRQNLARDPNYVPEQFKDNPDVMYDKGFVDSAYNPEPVPREHSSSGVGAFFFWFFVVVIAVIVGGAIVYFVFIHEYK